MCDSAGDLNQQTDNPNDRALTAKYDDQVPTVVQTYIIYTQGS